jgi:branched-chain amino acid transport system permease protein
MGFVGVGSAVGAWATATQGWDLSLALLVAGIAGAFAAVVVGLPALRLRGLFLAVTTLAFTIAASNYLLNPQYARWIPLKVERVPLFGTIDLTSERAMYELCLVVLGLSVLALTGLRRSRTGRVLLAVRENERGVQAYGVNLTRTKLAAFAVSGFLAAVAGCLFIHVVGRYSADQYGATTSFAVFTSTVVGGLGSLTGGILGAIFGRGGTWFLPGNWQLLPSAIGVLVVLWVFPGGLGGLWFKLRDLWLRSVAVRNGILVPSMVADVGQWERPLEDAEEAAEAHDAAETHGGAADDHEPATGGDSPPGAAGPPGAPATGAHGIDATDVTVGGAP